MQRLESAAVESFALPMSFSVTKSLRTTALGPLLCNSSPCPASCQAGNVAFLLVATPYLQIWVFLQDPPRMPLPLADAFICLFITHTENLLDITTTVLKAEDTGEPLQRWSPLSSSLLEELTSVNFALSLYPTIEYLLMSCQVLL